MSRVTQSQIIDAFDEIVHKVDDQSLPLVRDEIRMVRAFIAQHPDQPSTLYDWSDPSIPKRTKWIATDAYGSVWCYAQRKPESGSESFINNADTAQAFRLGNRPDLAPNWRNSLERRPKS